MTVVKVEKKAEKDEKVRALGGSENGRLEDFGKHVSKKDCFVANKVPLAEGLRGFLGC